MPTSRPAGLKRDTLLRDLVAMRPTTRRQRSSVRPLSTSSPPPLLQPPETIYRAESWVPVFLSDASCVDHSEPLLKRARAADKPSIAAKAANTRLRPITPFSDVCPSPPLAGAPRNSSKRLDALNSRATLRVATPPPTADELADSDECTPTRGAVDYGLPPSRRTACGSCAACVQPKCARCLPYLQPALRKRCVERQCTASATAQGWQRPAQGSARATLFAPAASRSDGGGSLRPLKSGGGRLRPFESGGGSLRPFESGGGSLRPFESGGGSLLQIKSSTAAQHGSGSAAGLDSGSAAELGGGNAAEATNVAPACLALDVTSTGGQFGACDWPTFPVASPFDWPCATQPPPLLLHPQYLHSLQQPLPLPEFAYLVPAPAYLGDAAGQLVPALLVPALLVPALLAYGSVPEQLSAAACALIAMNSAPPGAQLGLATLCAEDSLPTARADEAAPSPALSRSSPLAGTLALANSALKEEAALRRAANNAASRARYGLLSALSVKQPFASALALGLKRVENRSYALKIHPGTKGRWFALHASRTIVTAGARKRPSASAQGAVEEGEAEAAPTEVEEMLARALDGLTSAWGANMPPTEQLPVGRVIGFFRVYACVRAGSAEVATDPQAVGPFCWLVDSVYALDSPVVCAGQRGQWRLPPHMEIEIPEEVERECRVVNSTLKLAQCPVDW